MAVKQPEKTRDTLLDAAYREIHRNGFQAASLDRILEGTGVTRGALYHHFGNKLELGYAVVDERVAAWLQEKWLAPLLASSDALMGLEASIAAVLEQSSDEMIRLGCPINNLVQEMSPIDEGFRTRLQSVLDTWRGTLAKELTRGQSHGLVRQAIDPAPTAAFLVAALEGISGMAKNAGTAAAARAMIDVLLDYIDGLRPEPSAGSPGPA
ncbi:MAG: TetR/AcrR family transcriptional regulator [Gemmatimonadetes bacterium]|nr:TetR/AcrR family transcriptional regulator [Gemmatimonadota bacterium]